MTASDVPGLLRALLTDDPSRPRLTWYGPDDDRVELSSKLLDNWVAKTANLLVDELDAGPGTRVAIALPPHWRAVTWLLAVWSVGACVVAVPPGGDVPGDVDVLVGDDARLLASAGPQTLRAAVALDSLASVFPGDLPPDTLDYALEVRGYGDVFVPFVRPAGGDPAYQTPSLTLTHDELVPAAEQAARAADLPPRPRLLTGAGPDDALAGLLAPLVRSGSVVLHHDLPALVAAPEALAHLIAQERATPTPHLR